MEIKHVRPENCEKYLEGFIETYREAFGGPPYFEVYKDEDILKEVWMPHLKNGLILVACEGDSVIGLICAIPLLKSPDEIQNYLRIKQQQGSFSLEFKDTWYISELGVRVQYRRRGIATRLVKECLIEIEKSTCSHYVLRTAVNNAISQRLFKKIGAVELPGTQCILTSKQVQIHGSKSTQRLYLYGNCKEGIKRLQHC